MPASTRSEAAKSSGEEWKTRPPYKKSMPTEFDTKYEGQCHCGNVHFKISRDTPLDAKYCHCTDCQRQHSAPFQWAAIFEKSDISFNNGVEGLEFYDSSHKKLTHELPCKVRCSFCKAPIMDEGRNMCLLFPTLITFKKETDMFKFRAKKHMFYGKRVVDINDGYTKWTGLDKSSEIMPEEQLFQGARFEKMKREEEKQNGNE